MNGRAWGIPAALLLVFAGAVVAIDRLAPEPGGPSGSSYATAPDGAAAYADLLSRAGHPVRRLRVPLAERPPDPGTTLVVLDPGHVAGSEARAIARFLDAGGRLVAGGGPARWLAAALGSRPDWAPSQPGRAAVGLPLPETAGVEAVTFADGGRWARPRGALPLLATEAGTTVAVALRGRGRAILLADASPLHNRGLATDDAAALGLALAGGGRRPVAFLETVHGYGTETGVAALPARALWVIAGLMLAALAYLSSIARRLGPPEDEERALAPPRRRYVEAVARALGAGGDERGIAAAAARAARRRLAARAGLPPAAGAADLRDAAARLGLDESERAAILAPEDDADALAAGRALARLEAGRR